MRLSALIWIPLLAGCGSSGDGTDSGSPVDSGSSSDSAMMDSGVMEAAADSPMDGPMVSGCVDSTASGDHRFTCDGIVYDVAVPPACTGGGCGVVLDVHGLTMSGRMEDNNTNMRALGAQYGYVVVQPNANPAPPQSSWTPATDDDKVFKTLQLVVSTFKIDPKKIHMTGFSQGGMMTFRFLCKHADTFASMAPGAGTNCSFVGNDKPSQEVPVLYMHGTKDVLVNFNTAAIPQRDALVNGWNMGAGTKIAGDSAFTRTQYTSPNGTVFEFIQHDYAATSFALVGHCYPGSMDPGNQPGQLFAFKCVGPNSFTWGDEAMKFFVAHPKK
jgi:hypothetical protein